MSKLLSDEELRKSLKDFLKGGLLNDGTLNPNTLNTLERFINTQKRLYAENARKQAYSLGFDTAKKTYMHKMVRRNELLRVYAEIAIAYKQTTGVESDLFIEYLNDKSENQLRAESEDKVDDQL